MTAVRERYLGMAATNHRTSEHGSASYSRFESLLDTSAARPASDIDNAEVTLAEHHAIRWLIIASLDV
jgi:hypothetical protein